MTSPELIRDDPAWFYLGFAGPATRRLRVWRVDPDHVVAIVTEHPTNVGTSVTNAAESVAAQLAIEYPTEHVEIIEQYTASVIAEEHYDAVTMDADGRPCWRRVALAELVARLGPAVVTT